MDNPIPFTNNRKHKVNTMYKVLESLGTSLSLSLTCCIYSLYIYSYIYKKKVLWDAEFFWLRSMLYIWQM